MEGQCFFISFLRFSQKPFLAHDGHINNLSLQPETGGEEVSEGLGETEQPNLGEMAVCAQKEQRGAGMGNALKQEHRAGGGM